MWRWLKNIFCRHQAQFEIAEHQNGMTHGEIEQYEQEFSWIDQIKVCSNMKTGKWEVYVTSESNKDYFIGYSDTKEGAIKSAKIAATNFIRKELPIFVLGEIRSSIKDNTCRARECKWNVNDSCVNLPRDASLPLPEVNPFADTWTEEKNVVPRLCPQYEKAEI